MEIKISNICKKYRAGKKTVLDNVELKAKSGECIGILGVNGSGKTTLLSILAGINKANEGSFVVDGVDILDKGKEISKLVGYVPQGNPLMEELNAKDNLRLWYCDSILDMKKELEEGVLKMLGIPEFLHVRVSRMSGGMKKRLSIGCAVANNPRILILDEPGASLDIICKNQIADYLIRYKAEGGVIFLTTHEEKEIELCDRIYILKNGHLEETDCRNPDMLAKMM